MSQIVVDASVLLRALLPGQDPNGAVRAAITETMGASLELLAPDLLSYELGQAASRFRAEPSARCAILPRSLQIATLVRPSPEAHQLALESAVDDGLSYYDASYVALARARGIVLWTEDRQLLRDCADVAVDTTTLRSRIRA